MNIEIKKSVKPVNYFKAINLLEARLQQLYEKKEKELIWILKHNEIFTAGTSYKKNEIIDKSIDLIETSRGGKITWHGPGQLICYLAINLNNRNKDIRKFLNIIENTIIISLKDFGINSYSDRKNIGIWIKLNNKDMKVAAIGIKVPGSCNIMPRWPSALNSSPAVVPSSKPI